MTVTIELDTNKTELTLHELVELIYEQYYLTDTFIVQPER